MVLTHKMLIVAAGAPGTRRAYLNTCCGDGREVVGFFVLPHLVDTCEHVLGECGELGFRTAQEAPLEPRRLAALQVDLGKSLQHGRKRLARTIF